MLGTWLVKMFLGSLCLLVSAPQTASSQGAMSQTVGQPTPPPSKTQLKRSLSAALREEALARSPEQLSDAGAPQQQYSEAVLRLCDLYAQIRGDGRYIDSEMLQKLSFTLRKRLLEIAHRLEADLQRRDVQRPAWIATTSAAIRQTGPSGLSARKSVQTDAAVQLGGSAGGGAIDNGWQLVELIQQTIAPGFWDTTGGPGTIYYYALKRALVVRATSEVHADLGILLKPLRRN